MTDNDMAEQSGADHELYSSMIEGNLAQELGDDHGLYHMTTESNMGEDFGADYEFYEELPDMNTNPEQFRGTQVQYIPRADDDLYTTLSNMTVASQQQVWHGQGMQGAENDFRTNAQGLRSGAQSAVGNPRMNDDGDEMDMRLGNLEWYNNDFNLMPISHHVHSSLGHSLEKQDMADLPRGPLLYTHQDIQNRLENHQPGFMPLIHSTQDFHMFDAAYMTLRNIIPNPAHLIDMPTSDHERLAHIQSLWDAFHSTEKAKDAEGQAKRFLSNLSGFEIQRALWQLQFRMEAAQRGEYQQVTHSATKPVVYESFQARFDGMVEALETYKSFCKNLFDDEITMREKLAMNPAHELDRKRGNDRTIKRKAEQVTYSIAHMAEEDLLEELRSKKRLRTAHDSNNTELAAHGGVGVAQDASGDRL